MPKAAEKLNRSRLFHVEKFKGLNLNTTATQIEDNEAVEMVNIQLDEVGALEKRTGYERVFPISLGPGAINGMFKYKDKLIVAHGGKLYEFELKEV